MCIHCRYTIHKHMHVRMADWTWRCNASAFTRTDKSQSWLIDACRNVMRALICIYVFTHARLSLFLQLLGQTTWICPNSHCLRTFASVDLLKRHAATCARGGCSKACALDLTHTTYWPHTQFVGQNVLRPRVTAPQTVWKSLGPKMCRYMFESLLIFSRWDTRQSNRSRFAFSAAAHLRFWRNWALIRRTCRPMIWVERRAMLQNPRIPGGGDALAPSLMSRSLI